MKALGFPFLYKIYRRKLFPKISKIRGTTRLSNFLAKLASLSLKRYPYPPYTVLDFDWDVLIILDACRYDLFCKYLGKECSYIISVGSKTGEWFKNTFRERRVEDIVYVSGNPWISKYFVKKLFGSIPFYHLEEVWKYGWDERIGTTLPSEVTRASIKLVNRYPSKRFIIHYLQPHHPFVKLRFRGVYPFVKLNFKKIHNEDIYRWWRKGVAKSVWYFFEQGMISKEKILDAYYYNLIWVMNEVKKLGKILKMKKQQTFITSDHGNHLGENNIYAHLKGLRTEELVKVPWIDLEEVI